MKTTYELQKMSGAIYGYWERVGNNDFGSQNAAIKAACRYYDKDGGDYRVIELEDGKWDPRFGWRLVLLDYQLEKEECACCGKEVRHMDLFQTRDFNGIPYRWVCKKCYKRVMYKGYDGERYSDLDECLYECY